METIDYSEALAWLRYVLTNSALPSISDWQGVYDFCDKQKIGGVCEPTHYDVHVKDDVLLEWMALNRLLNRANEQTNKRVCQLFRMLEGDGFRCCLLKGQGNAEMYKDPLLRYPGDIDVWVDADRKTVCEYVKRIFPNPHSNYMHVEYPIFKDVLVELHYFPLKFRHPLFQRRFQRWLDENKEEQFNHSIKLIGTEDDISVPTFQFNVIYQLGHIMTHVFDEGIGLRQLIDYYYVLKNLKGISEKEKEQIRRTWKRFGMGRLASAIMWIEHEVLGLPEQYLLTTPGEKWGRKILDDTLEGGNFGKYSQRRVNVGLGRINKRTATFKRLISLFPCFPGETVFRLLARTKAMFKRDLGKMINLSVR